MESTSRPGCIQVSEVTYAMLDEDQRSLFEATGGVEVKGKGLMQTYIYQPTEDVSTPPLLPLGLPKAKPEVMSFDELRTLRQEMKPDASKNGHSTRLHHQGPPSRASLYSMSMAALGIKLGVGNDDEDYNDITLSNQPNLWSNVANRLNTIAGGAHKTSLRHGPQSTVLASTIQRRSSLEARSQFERRSETRDVRS